MERKGGRRGRRVRRGRLKRGRGRGSRGEKVKRNCNDGLSYAKIKWGVERFVEELGCEVNCDEGFFYESLM